MKLTPFFQLNKINMTTSRYVAITLYQQIMTPPLYFRFSENFEHSGNQILVKVLIE